MEQDPYDAIKFGEFRKYMQNKKAKLKDQEKDVAYKVVKPTWITESIKESKLLPWTRYRVIPKNGAQRELPFAKSLDSTLSGTLEPQEKTVQSNGQSVSLTKKLPDQSLSVVKTPETDQNLDATAVSSEQQRHITTANPNFLKSYYNSSRLHYLSKWKAELRDIVRKLEDKYPPGLRSTAGRKRKRVDALRIVMHVDFDCFFASVGLLERPELRDKPVAVSHGKGLKDGSSSDIASCNYVARAYGICNGTQIGAAKQKCPDLQVIPYEFEKYKSISEKFYEILFQYADEIQAVSVDEALIEVASHITQLDAGQEEELAGRIRNDIRETTGCEASIGIGPNILLARLATRKAKPCGQFHCKPENVQSLLNEQDVSDLPGVGYVMYTKLTEMNVHNVVELSAVPLSKLQAKLGPKTGWTLYNFSRGIDDRPLSTGKPRQSVSADVSWGIRFENNEEAEKFVEELSKEISIRLRDIGRKGKSITLKILRRKLEAGQPTKYLGCGLCDSFSKSVYIDEFTDDSSIQKLDTQYSAPATAGQQNTLDFLVPKVKPIWKKQRQDDDLKNITESSKSSNKEKPSMPVDESVYNELPKQLRDELSATYNLVFLSENERRDGLEQSLDLAHIRPSSESDMTTTTIPEHPMQSTQDQAIQSLPDLPPWSQLDPNALLALPDNMREQILSEYGTGATTDSRSGVRRKTVKDSPTINAKVTLTQIFPQNNSSRNTYDEDIKGTSSKLDDTDYVPWDLDVLNELPADMRKEILANHRLEKEMKNRDIRNQHFKQAKNRLLDNNAPVVVIPSHNEPTLIGKTSIQAIREVLQQWVSSYPDEPEPEDVETVENFVIELVDDKNLEKAQLVVMYLDQLVRDDRKGKWSMYVSGIRQRLSKAVETTYRCHLRFS
ncbi:deoxycytidyl transferase [Apophysomyces sp. BC1021]|nr:deoxycytidyl transferase [Apophysomyces sp. BC1021]